MIKGNNSYGLLYQSPFKTRAPLQTDERMAFSAFVYISY